MKIRDCNDRRNRNSCRGRFIHNPRDPCSKTGRKINDPIATSMLFLIYKVMRAIPHVDGRRCAKKKFGREGIKGQEISMNEEETVAVHWRFQR